MDENEDFMDGEESLTGEGDVIADYLLKAIEEAKSKPTAEDKLDYSAFREECKEDWLDVAEGETLPLQVRSLLKKSVLLPREAFQLPIALAYLMLPSAVCNRVPILFSQGMSGCGKSTLGYIACAIHNRPPIGAGSTFASLRNAVAELRVWDVALPVDYPGNEKNSAMIWEDIAANDLLGADGSIFALLKNGTERTGTITIANKDGGNKVFKIFSPKYISSIHPLYARHEFRELVRRVIVLQHKPRHIWTAEDFDSSNESASPDDLIDLSELNFSSLKTSFREFWEDRENLETWGKTARSVNAIRSHGMNSNDYKMSKDLITCGVVCGIWEDVSEAIGHLKAYWEWHKANIESQSSATQKALSHLIETQTTETVKRNEEMIKAGLKNLITPLEIPAETVKRYIDSLRAQGELDTQGSTADITAAMAQLGWELKPNAMKKNSWQPINR